MPRPKLPEGEAKETVGVKLPPAIIDEIDELGANWDLKRGSVGRELLLLGLALVRGMHGDLPLSVGLSRQSGLLGRSDLPAADAKMKRLPVGAG